MDFFFIKKHFNQTVTHLIDSFDIRNKYLDSCIPIIAEIPYRGFTMIICHITLFFRQSQLTLCQLGLCSKSELLPMPS